MKILFYNIDIIVCMYGFQLKTRLYFNNSKGLSALNLPLLIKTFK